MSTPTPSLGSTRDRLRVGADEITFEVTSQATGGALLAGRVRVPAGGGPPAMHRHAPEEVYRGERGELAVYLEDEDGEVQRVVVTPGVVVHIPGGRSHTLRNESGAEAMAFVVFVPGAEIERFFRAAAALGADGAPDPGDVVALAERHGVEFTGPVPGQTARAIPPSTRTASPVT